MKKLTYLSLAVALVATAACQTAKDEFLSSGAVKHSKDELMADTSGYTWQWRNGKGAGYYAPDGTYVYTSSDGNGQGSWNITDDGTLCLQVKEWFGAKNHCNWEVYVKDGKRYSYDIKKAKMNPADYDRRSKGNTL